MTSRRQGDAGTATIEFVWLSLILLVPLVYILIAVFDTQRAAYGVSTASRSAARAFLQSTDVASGEQRARIAARVALDDQGLGAATVDVTCLPSPRECLEPGSSVRVVVRATQPLPLTPKVLGRQLGGVTVDSTHTEPFGSFPGGPVRREDGTITVMTVGFLLFLALLAVVVINASAAFLQRQQLDNLADGAALAAADGLSGDTFYRTGQVTLDGPAARQLVDDYVTGDGIRIVEVLADADEVQVRLERSVSLAFAPPGWESRTTIVSEATAQLRQTP